MNRRWIYNLIYDTRNDDLLSSINFDLPKVIYPKETVTIVVKGSSDGTCSGFRAWVGNSTSSGTVTPYRIEKLAAGCKKVKTIIINSKHIKKIDKNTFAGIKSKHKVYVPKSMVSLYKKLTGK